MKNIKLFTITIIMLTLFVSSGCTKKDDSTQSNNTKQSSSTIYSELPSTPSEVVQSYLKYTLGSIPGAKIDYDKAKKLLTSKLEAKFTSPMFVPASYCIQDGPDDVKVKSAVHDSKNNWTDVIIQAKYSSKWKNMWSFTVVPVEGDDWMIKEIKCLNN